MSIGGDPGWLAVGSGYVNTEVLQDTIMCDTQVVAVVMVLCGCCYGVWGSYYMVSKVLCVVAMEVVSQVFSVVTVCSSKDIASVASGDPRWFLIRY